MSIMLGTAVIMVVMLQQHLYVVQVATKQAFLSHEAPQIGDLLGRIFNQTDHYFVFASRTSALNGEPPVLVDGQAVQLYFKTATQETLQRMIAVETTATGKELRFYTPQPDGTTTSWLVCNQISDANFSNDQGILSVTLEGPNGEEVTYSGGAR